MTTDPNIAKVTSRLDKLEVKEGDVVVLRTSALDVETVRGLTSLVLAVLQDRGTPALVLTLPRDVDFDTFATRDMNDAGWFHRDQIALLKGGPLPAPTDRGGDASRPHR